MFGNSPRALTVGEFARRVGTTSRRIEWWGERGFITVEGVGNGPGSRRRIPASELRVVSRVLELIEQYGVRASGRLFEVARCEVE